MIFTYFVTWPMHIHLYVFLFAHDSVGLDSLVFYLCVLNNQASVTFFPNFVSFVYNLAHILLFLVVQI